MNALSAKVSAKVSAELGMSNNVVVERTGLTDSLSLRTYSYLAYVVYRLLREVLLAVSGQTASATNLLSRLSRCK
eukprot:scaffold34129_cov51-Attheya_sp.AAC.2